MDTYANDNIISETSGYTNSDDMQTKTHTIFCTLCTGKVFKNKNSLRAHRHKMHRENFPTGVLCDKKIVYQKQFKSHICPKGSCNETNVDIQTENYTICCTLCPEKVFKNRKSLKTHRHKMHRENLPTCVICDKKFAYKKQFESHICPKTTATTSNLSTDVEKYTEVQNASNSLSNHINDLEIKREMIICPKCPGKTFKKKKAFYTHNSIVHREKRFQCKNCPKMFAFQSQLERHDKHHSHVCVECNATFSNYHKYQNHQRESHNMTHPLKIKSHNCDICDTSFLSRVQLKDHIRIKHEELRFCCDTCQKCYKHERNLKLHIKHNHENIRYNCTHSNCHISYVTKRALKKHEKHHETGTFVPNKSAIDLKSPEEQNESDASKSDKSLIELLQSSITWRKKRLVL